VFRLSLRGLVACNRNDPSRCESARQIKLNIPLHGSGTGVLAMKTMISARLRNAKPRRLAGFASLP
jgi:hypothetical protein